jgi:hypothetical protein
MASAPELPKATRFGKRSRRDPGHFFRQLRQQGVIEIRPRHVDQGLGLLLDHAHHIGVAMPGGDHGNSRGKIQEEIAINVFNDCAPSALGHQRIVAGIGRRNDIAYRAPESSGLRAREAASKCAVAWFPSKSPLSAA